MPRLLQFALFFTLLIAIFSLFQVYLFHNFRLWYLRAFPDERHPLMQRAGFMILLVGNILFLSQFFLRSNGWYHHPLAQYLIVLPGSFFFASVVTGALLLLLKDGFRFLLFLVRLGADTLKGLSSADSTWDEPAASPVNEGRRQFLRLGGIGIATVSVGFPIVSSFATARDYQVNSLPLHFENLPPGLDGLTIAQVSDLHSGPFMMERDMLEIFEIVNSLSPNIITVTGDFVDSVDSEIPDVYQATRILKADYGVFGCLGNHDHFATAEKVNAALVQRDIIMLNNQHRLLSINGERLSLIGVDDFGGGRRNFARPELALDGVERDSFKIMLTHRPDFFSEAKKAGMDLTLAGHTHGGQVGIEIGIIKLNAVYLVHRYARGLYEEEGKKLYVNVGVGMVGVPIRLVRPEITLFTLKKS